ncbi:MAG: DUF86 domain-containing protein [Thermoprotei archaeon]|nr:MAG: DUF86 domain-containing protein [Thermoprotei archaeon]RLF22765.1 MAG: DUF86 domain-containing protein [Thermoprotei archaeon]
MSVDKEYVKKITVEIKDTVHEILVITSRPFDDLSRSDLMAIRYYLIVLAEALSSLALHIARRALGKKPLTPIEAFRILRDHHLITSEECDDIIKLVRLRNLLVHRYWTIDDKRIYDNIKKNFRELLGVVDKIARYVQVL